MYSTRQKGMIIGRTPFSRLVEWEDGTKEKVWLCDAPEVFAHYELGQNFDCVISRDEERRLERIIRSQRSAELPILSKEEFQQFFKQIPTSATLPDTGWD